MIKKDKKKGRGVYAKKAFKKGELIETCELLLLKLSDVPNSLEGYVFEFTKSIAAIALGNGSLYNHSENPNAAFVFNKKSQLLRFYALRAIEATEEVTVDYGYDEELKKKFCLS